MLIDTHAHFETLKGESGINSVMDRAVQAGVEHVIAVGGSLESNRLAVTAAQTSPRRASASIGYDREQVRGPLYCPENISSAVSGLKFEIERLSDQGTVVAAIGETGLDFHYSRDTVEAQLDLFARQLLLAGDMGLPVIVHSREAEHKTISEIRKYAELWSGPRERIGVLHCFTGSLEFAKRLLGLGFHISFSGIITFSRTAPLREVARMVPDDRLLIETDAPYMAPVPHRGKRNEPAYLPHVAQALAEIRGCSPERIAELTSGNAIRLFELHSSDLVS